MMAARKQGAAVVAGLTSWVSREVRGGAGLAEGRGAQPSEGEAWEGGAGGRQQLQVQLVTQAGGVDELLGPLCL